MNIISVQSQGQQICCSGISRWPLFYSLEKDRRKMCNLVSMKEGEKQESRFKDGRRLAGRGRMLTRIEVGKKNIVPTNNPKHI